jgi:hypothetical protein
MAVAVAETLVELWPCSKPVIKVKAFYPCNNLERRVFL